jgi:hypothetical protein
MNRLFCFCLLMLSLLTASLPAHAFPGGRGGGSFQVQQRQHPPQGDRQLQHAPRRQDAQPNPPPQRMSPDERRQLRRDLRDAGRDVYPQRRDGRR